MKFIFVAADNRKTKRFAMLHLKNADSMTNDWKVMSSSLSVTSDDD